MCRNIKTCTTSRAGHRRGDPGIVAAVRPEAEWLHAPSGPTRPRSPGPWTRCAGGARAARCAHHERGAARSRSRSFEGPRQGGGRFRRPRMPELLYAGSPRKPGRGHVAVREAFQRRAWRLIWSTSPPISAIGRRRSGPDPGRARGSVRGQLERLVASPARSSGSRCKPRPKTWSRRARRSPRSAWAGSSSSPRIGQCAGAGATPGDGVVLAAGSSAGSSSTRRASPERNGSRGLVRSGTR